jgi:hypothetical protein
MCEARNKKNLFPCAKNDLLEHFIGTGASPLINAVLNDLCSIVPITTIKNDSKEKRLYIA